MQRPVRSLFQIARGVLRIKGLLPKNCGTSRYWGMRATDTYFLCTVDYDLTKNIVFKSRYWGWYIISVNPNGIQTTHFYYVPSIKGIRFAQILGYSIVTTHFYYVPSIKKALGSHGFEV